MTVGAQCPTLTQCCLPNGDFAQASCIGSGSFLPASLGIPNSNCVPFWTATHGGPGVYTISNPSNYARLTSQSSSQIGPTSEGIRTNFNFIQNTKYEITFKMRCHDPFNQILAHNPGTLSVRAMNNGPSAYLDGFGNLSWEMPPLPAQNQLITSISTNALPYTLKNWETITVNYTPTASYNQLWFYLNSISSGISVLVIDDVSIKIAPPTSQFHMQTSSNPAGTPTTQFTTCQRIFLNGLASVNDQNHYIDVWKKATGSGNPFVWAGNYGATGWTATPAGVVDITNAMDNTFDAGYDYRIKMATQNTCTGWVESTVDISVVAGVPPPNPVTQIEGNTPGLATTILQECDGVYLVETYESTHGNNYTQYFVDLWERDYALGGQFQWIGQIGGNGWTPGIMPARLNIKSIFNGQGIYFIPGKEYQVKLALANSCSSWVPYISKFRIINCTQPLQKSTNENDPDSIHSDESGKLTVSPNPAENTITLSADGFEKTLILNSLGQTVISNNDGSSLIDISMLPSGFYLVVATAPNGKQQQTTFIKD
ncbi:MAG: T9SS type A sorting domain-containing protein [Fluviicola sp.]|nr:T9SS type A sorting domain-containing protein [Fluviicola sp.]